MTRTLILTVLALLSFVIASFFSHKSEVKWHKYVWYAAFIAGFLLIIVTGIDAFQTEKKLEKLSSPWTWGELRDGKQLK